MISKKKYKIRLIKSSFYNESDTKKKIIQFIKKTETLSMNINCMKFESNFSRKQKRKYSTFFNSGSSANLALMRAMLNLGRLKFGDRIGFSNLTWATNVMPIIELGFKPVAIDCNLKTLNVGVKNIIEAGEIKCLFITNVLGFSDDLLAIKKYCKEKNIILLEDNCESLGSVCGNRLLGNFGDAATFSFFVGHHMSTIEGGMVCTDNKELSDMLKMVRAHGWDRNLDAGTKSKIKQSNKVSKFYQPYTFYELGYNMRPMEINGLIGNIQLQYLDEIIEKRFKNFKYWNGIVKKNKDIEHLDFSHMNIVSNFAFPLIFKTKEKFNLYKKKFQSAGVEIRPIIAGDITQQPFYKKYVGVRKKVLKNSSTVHSLGFYFGNNPEMNAEEVRYVGKLLV